MSKSLRYFLDIKSYLDLGSKFFLLGVFFLPSAVPIGGFFLLIALIISFVKNNINFSEDKYNYPFYLSILLILLNTLKITFGFAPAELEGFDIFLIWLNLFNWIPIFFAYLGFQVYLVNKKQRFLFQKFLIAGTIPVIFSCFIQKFFNVYGPFETLYGSIIWFNYKLSGEEVFRITGLFNNPNYLATWLSLSLPFSITLIRKEKTLSLSNSCVYLINILILYFAILSGSRNAYLGIILSCIFFINFRKIISFTFIVLFTLFIIIFLFPINIELNSLFNLDPSRLEKLSNLKLSLSSTRAIIWGSAINLIAKSPLWGWGASTFSYMFNEKGFIQIPFQHFQANHTHNLILELAYNFGIPVAALSSLNISLIYLEAIKKISNTIDKIKIYMPWIISFGIFLISQLTDITYYDGRISILFCILLAGLRNIIVELKIPKNRFTINKIS